MLDNAKQIISPLEVRTRNGTRVETFLGSSMRSGFQAYESAGSFGNMSFHHYPGTNFNIWYSEYNVNGHTKLHARADMPLLELHIPFEKYFTYNWDGYYRTSEREKQYEISFTPFVDSISEFAGGDHYSTFDIHYDQLYLERFSYIAPVARFLEKVEKGEPANLVGEPKFLTPSMISLIHEMLNCRIDPLLAPMYYESGALMMLTLLLDQLVQQKRATFSSFDKECALLARDTMSQDLSKIYSVSELCRLAGTNELKLQHCFREMFGTTIFHYHQHLRLEHARKLLLDTYLPVQSIALDCGYSDNANLTAAFKKKFGCAPEQLRKSR